MSGRLENRSGGWRGKTDEGIKVMTGDDKKMRNYPVLLGISVYTKARRRQLRGKKQHSRNPGMSHQKAFRYLSPPPSFSCTVRAGRQYFKCVKKQTNT